MMHSNGFIDFISRKYADRKYLKIAEEDTGPKPIQMVHLYGAFKIYLISNFVAILVFGLELISKRLNLAFLSKLFLKIKRLVGK